MCGLEDGEGVLKPGAKNFWPNVSIWRTGDEHLLLLEWGCVMSFIGVVIHPVYAFRSRADSLKKEKKNMFFFFWGERETLKYCKKKKPLFCHVLAVQYWFFLYMFVCDHGEVVFRFSKASLALRICCIWRKASILSSLVSILVSSCSGSQGAIDSCYQARCGLHCGRVHRRAEQQTNSTNTNSLCWPLDLFFS